MKGRLIPITEVVSDEERAWRELADRSVDPNPMNEPGFVLAAAHHLPYGNDIQLVVAEEGDRFHGVMPIRRIFRSGNLILPVATTDIRRMTYLGTPLLDARGLEALRHMLLTLARERWRQGWGFVSLRWIGEGPASAMTLEAVADLRLPLTIWEDFEQPFLARRPSDSYTDHQSKRHINDYGRRARRLAEALDADLEVVDRGSDPSAVEEYIALEAAGYKRDTGVAMLTAPGEPEYFRAMCRNFAAEGRLRILCLQAAGRTIAMELFVQAAEGLFLIKVGYDESLGRFDPGIQLHLLGMSHFHEHTDAQWIDVCTFGGNDLLLRLYPDRRRTTTMLIGLGTGAERAVIHSLPRAREVWHGVRGQRAIRVPHRIGASLTSGGLRRPSERGR